MESLTLKLLETVLYSLYVVMNYLKRLREIQLCVHNLILRSLLYSNSLNYYYHEVFRVRSKVKLLMIPSIRLNQNITHIIHSFYSYKKSIYVIRNQNSTEKEQDATLPILWDKFGQTAHLFASISISKGYNYSIKSFKNVLIKLIISDFHKFMKIRSKKLLGKWSVLLWEVVQGVGCFSVWIKTKKKLKIKKKAFWNLSDSEVLYQHNCVSIAISVAHEIISALQFANA